MSITQANTLAALALGLSLAAAFQQRTHAGEAPELNLARPRSDLYGDPLPPGATARLGSMRFRHGSPVTSVAFSADGKTIVSAEQGNAVQLWEAASGKKLRQFHGGAPRAALAQRM